MKLNSCFIFIKCNEQGPFQYQRAHNLEPNKARRDLEGHSILPASTLIFFKRKLKAVSSETSPPSTN